jgi:hypothetical protein
MPKFRKKPVVIEAIEFDGTTAGAVAVFKVFDVPGGKFVPHYQNIERGFLTIPTLEGEMRADEGDWIIKGVKGEFYPCKPDIFEATYEAVT